MMPIERGSGIILGVHQNGEDGRVRTCSARNGVEQKRSAKAATVILAVDGQQADECCGNDWVARRGLKIRRPASAGRLAFGIEERRNVYRVSVGRLSKSPPGCICNRRTNRDSRVQPS